MSSRLMICRRRFDTPPGELAVYKFIVTGRVNGPLGDRPGRCRATDYKICSRYNEGCRRRRAEAFDSHEVTVSSLTKRRGES
jgi:hypothetical protein